MITYFHTKKVYFVSEWRKNDKTILPSWQDSNNWLKFDGSSKEQMMLRCSVKKYLTENLNALYCLTSLTIDQILKSAIQLSSHIKGEWLHVFHRQRSLSKRTFLFFQSSSGVKKNLLSNMHRANMIRKRYIHSLTIMKGIIQLCLRLWSTLTYVHNVWCLKAIWNPK